MISVCKCLQLSIRTRIAPKVHRHTFAFYGSGLVMEYIPKITSDRQEAIEKVEKVLEQIDAIGRQLHSNTEGNLGIKASANEIQPLSDTENVRYRRGCDIVNQKNQIIKLDRFRYRVKSQSSCGEYEVISTELGWTCTCADHRFRTTTCKHMFAIFAILKLEQEAGVQVRTELTHTYCGWWSIAGEGHNGEAWTITKYREPLETNQEPLTEGADQPDYEQELYEKDRYIEGLETEIRGLRSLTHSSREETL
jgi:hypothetical protein